jgi:hypothetical protein
MEKGYKIKSVVPKNKKPSTPRRFNKYTMICVCYFCKRKETLEAEEPTHIEYLLDGWVSFNLITDKDDTLIKYACPDCVHKISDPKFTIENENLEYEMLYK